VVEKIEREKTSTSRARHRHSPAVIIEHDLRMHRTNLPRWFDGRIRRSSRR